MKAQKGGKTAVIGRRQLLKSVGAASLVATCAAPWVARAKAPYELPKLPWPDDALQPMISATTIGFHYGKHHKAYVDTLNKLLADAPDLADLSIEELITATSGNPQPRRNLQQRRADVEPHLLLEQHAAKRRRQAGTILAAAD